LLEKKILAAIGEVSKNLNTAYNILLGLSTHDISAMRELLGMPKGVLYAAQRSGGLYITAAFDYGDFICHFETGIDDIARFDCHLEVYGKSQTLRVEYQSPYVRHQATCLNVIRAKPESGLHTEVIQPAFEDNFTQEWKAFYQNVTMGGKPKTSPEDYRCDLELFSQMMAKIRESSDARESAGVS
jgi:predicted dehydrogenase